MTVPGLLVLVLFLGFRLTNPVIYETFFARGIEFALREAGDTPSGNWNWN
ncbi:hypothetical protein ACFQL4_06580 [Halosimplex aquaticum]